MKIDLKDTTVTASGGELGSFEGQPIVLQPGEKYENPPTPYEAMVAAREAYAEAAKAYFGDAVIPRRVKVSGDGTHSFTTIVDADTGEDLGRSLQIGSVQIKTELGQPVLILEARCPVVLDLQSA